MIFNSQQWLRTRQRLLRQLKNQVRMRTGVEPIEIFRYAKNYEKEFTGKWREVAESRFLIAANKFSIILGGDFHAFPQSQKSHLRLLRELCSKNKIILAVECVESQYQTVLNDYLNRKISEEEFVSRVRWSRHWNFPWENYRPLFQWAREQKVPVIALNLYLKNRTIENLNKRDRHAAKILAMVRERDDQSLIYVVYGDLHLAKNHLLAACRREKIFLNEKILRLFFNVEKLYFREIKKQKKSFSQIVLKGSGDRYCLLNSPPWLKWQSYLMYLEQTYDQELEDVVGIDYTDHVAGLIRLAGEDLGIELNPQDIAVYSSADHAFPQITKGCLSSQETKICMHLIKYDRSFFLPAEGNFYLSRPSINHASSLAGQYIQARLSGRTRPPWKMPNDFLSAIWIEGVSFFISKLINPHRKSESLESIRQELEASDMKGRARETLLIVLDQRMSELIKIQNGKTNRKRYLVSQSSHYIDASRILGNMMGQRLFLLFKDGRWTRSDLIKMISRDVFSDHFQNDYYQWIKKIETYWMKDGNKTVRRKE